MPQWAGHSRQVDATNVSSPGAHSGPTCGDGSGNWWEKAPSPKPIPAPVAPTRKFRREMATVVLPHRWQAVQSVCTLWRVWQFVHVSMSMCTSGRDGGAVVSAMAPWQVAQGNFAMVTCRRCE